MPGVLLADAGVGKTLAIASFLRMLGIRLSPKAGNNL